MRSRTLLGWQPQSESDTRTSYLATGTRTITLPVSRMYVGAMMRQPLSSMLFLQYSAMSARHAPLSGSSQSGLVQGLSFDLTP